MLAPLAQAGPSGGQINAGTGSIQQSGTTTTIDQSSPKLSINWQDFSIGANEAVRFNQPNASSVVLNRVIGQEPSKILGSLSANGQVFVVNPNGVLFGASAQVNVGGLVASTLDVSDADFMLGNYHFGGTGTSGGSVVNQGSLTAAPGGYIALLAPQVRNEGQISASQGTALLGAADRVTLRLSDASLLGYSIEQGALNALVDNQQAIRVDGGRAILSASALDALGSAVVNNSGIVEAKGLSTQGGVIRLEADLISQTGTLDASASGAQDGGSIGLNARAILDAGMALANGHNGGSIGYNARDALVQTASAQLQANGNARGGSVRLDGGNSLFSSATLDANGAQGGSIDLLGQHVVLSAATMDASGTDLGGQVRVGGDFHGANASLANAQTTVVNGASQLRADGGQGQVVIWSDRKTDYYGSISANQGGRIEVSSKGTLTYGGRADTGPGGMLLLDPANIVLDNSLGPAAFALIDPHPVAGAGFGQSTTLLVGSPVNGRLAVSVANDTLGGSAAGAVYLFNTTTGALISTLIGSQANDLVGQQGVTALSNGNFLVSSSQWNAATGAVTWGNGSSGISGVVSSSNSLIGSAGGQLVGNTGNITLLANGNYVVASTRWNGSRGAATWGSGSSGISGVISATNSQVGSLANDRVGTTVTALSNGNYVVNSPFWNVRRGAATWGNGSGGSIGAVTVANSLTGTAANDSVGNNGAVDLGNGSYVVNSSNWSTGKGAVTWLDGSGATSATVSAANSLVGTTNGDSVGNGGIYALSNHNYVVRSSNWNGSRGAATWGSGAGGIAGAVSSLNSLVGSSATDQVGSGGVGILGNGNYVVVSGAWNGDIGAVTWGNGGSGTAGAVSASNSLVGTLAGDRVGFGGVLILSTNNYVVTSSVWNGNLGAVTWGDGAGGTTIGAVSAANSLVGSAPGDRVGNANITPLSNGNYVVKSTTWNGNLGAATWGNGNGGTVGVVSASNSLVGTSAGDAIGSSGVLALSNGNYVVRSGSWNGGMGATTWGNGNGSGSSGGIVGTVSAGNSLVGSTAGDAVGFEYAIALNNGNYVVASAGWDAGRGAATWGNGSGGTVGAVSVSNSLVGSSAGDQVGIGTSLYALSDGNYVVTSRLLNGNRGAVTWGRGTVGTRGAVSFSNSLLGTAGGDFVGSGGVTDLGAGNYLASSPSAGGTGQLEVGVPGNIAFATGSASGSTIGFNPSVLTDTLAGGTAVSLQASNDITVNADISVTGSTGGALSLQAGRNINLNAAITTANGNFSAIAGDLGAIPAYRLAGTPTITLGAGASIQAGSGTVTLAAIGGDFVNQSGSAAPIAAGRILVYSSSPATDSKGGMVLGNKHYNQTYAGAPPAYAPTGNWFFYSIAPVLSVAPSTQTVAYGSNPGNFTPDFAGFIDGDTVGTAGITGSAAFAVGGAKSAANYFVEGSHEVSFTGGLLSSLGYSFADRTASVNELTVTPSGQGASVATVGSYGAVRTPDLTCLGPALPGQGASYAAIGSDATANTVVTQALAQSAQSVHYGWSDCLPSMGNAVTVIRNGGIRLPADVAVESQAL